MPTDMDIIRELEEEIGGKLRKEDVIMEDIVGYLGIPEKGGYCVDSKGHVTSLILESLFSGIFPLSVLKLVNLVHLSVHDNRLTALPPEITQFTDLKKLKLGENLLRELSPEFSHMTNLEELYLNNNRLTTIPTEITQLTNLKKLDISANQLGVFPEREDEQMSKHGDRKEYNVNIYAPSALAIDSENFKQQVSSSDELTELFQQMIEALRADSSLIAEQRDQLQADIEKLRQELSSKSPRRQIVERYLSNLGSVASLASLANQVAPFLPLLIKAGG
jgi:hypothetical protein